MSAVRTIQTSNPSGSKLTNATFVNGPSSVNDVVKFHFLSTNRSVMYGSQWDNFVRSTDDGATWTTIKKVNNGDTITGGWQLPNGEVILSTKVSAGRGGLWVSTGFPANETAATWTKVVTVNQSDNYVHDAWGLSFAPKGHVREGLVVATEYGGQGNASTAANDGSRAVWLSTDYGQTFRQIFDLFTFTGKVLSAHMHGVAYDPFDDRVLVTFGDGNSGSGTPTGIAYSDDFLAITPTWHYISGPFTDSTFQATGILPLANGILMGGDGKPPGIYRLPRRGYRQYGPMQTVLNYGGGTDTGFIGQRMFQAGPGQPIIIAHEWAKNSARAASLHMTRDGLTFTEIWRDDRELNYSGVLYVVGPTASGKVWGFLKADNRGANPRSYMTAELQID